LLTELSANPKILISNLPFIVEKNLISDVEQGKAILSIFAADPKNISDEKFEQCKKLLESIKNKNNEILTCLQKVGRLLTKWTNITECERQFVNADPAWTAILFGHCSPKSYQMTKTEISFNGDYTVLNEAK